MPVRRVQLTCHQSILAGRRDSFLGQRENERREISLAMTRRIERARGRTSFPTFCPVQIQSESGGEETEHLFPDRPTPTIGIVTRAMNEASRGYYVHPSFSYSYPKLTFSEINER